MNRFKEGFVRGFHWLLLCFVAAGPLSLDHALGQEAVDAPGPVLQESAELVQASDSATKGGIPIDEGGVQAAAMSAGAGGGADPAGAGSSGVGQPMSNPFNFQTDLITGQFER